MRGGAPGFQNILDDLPQELWEPASRIEREEMDREAMDTEIAKRLRSLGYLE